ncbi:wall-associated receptor kinase 1-like isoform X1 [Hordeum vulgare subsp. vulgare]|nr:wall-associated receptor kinase 1-like isoform X1 [Hordeum vulgare subsp. vulgare]
MVDTAILEYRASFYLFLPLLTRIISCLLLVSMRKLPTLRGESKTFLRNCIIQAPSVILTSLNFNARQPSLIELHQVWYSMANYSHTKSQTSLKLSIGVNCPVHAMFALLILARILTTIAMTEARASAVLVSVDRSTAQPLNRLISRLETRSLRDDSTGMGSSNFTLPSTSSCANICGNLSFIYPFGIGDGCFRNSDFSLVCNHTTHPPKLFLDDDSTTQVTANIDAGGMTPDAFLVNFSKTIPMKPGVDGYNMSWTPGNSFTALESMVLTIVACDLDVYLVDKNVGNLRLVCKVTCPSKKIAEQVYMQDPRGPGSCSVNAVIFVHTVELQFVRHKTSKMKTHSHLSILWDTINVNIETVIEWSIVDQTSCSSSKEDSNYACVSHHSECMVPFTHVGYVCRCKSGYGGNPYISGGCLPDHGYSSRPRKANCSRWCGNISVPFPFGIEEGCSARKTFELHCSDTTLPILQTYGGLIDVTYINVSEGLLGIKYDSSFGEEIFNTILQSSEPQEPTLYVDPLESASVRWAVDSLTCQEAKKNASGYACVSIHSSCLGVISSNKSYVGYRCACLDGFEGNPYITDGCEDIDECKRTPGLCKGNCHNTVGNYTCTKCPDHTEYDITKMQCTPVRKQNLLLGIVIGLSSGFGMLLFGLIAIFLIRRWKRDVQEKLRRKYFRTNKGLLLEQLISADENASENTKIFSIQELKKATNNFDLARILGHGGHGTVYKGILSNQHVVAIKKSQIIREGEISDFINEVAILSQINHRNIVKLFGCCLETEVPLLVYDFIPNGSLFEILHHDPSNIVSLTWNDCLRIASETAGALCYLHSAASISIFHRDVKSSNILLDVNNTAKVSDFGASRTVPMDQTHLVTAVQGTFGYLDPEYYQTGQLNQKSDVYSFGVVLLELLIRKKPIFTAESGMAESLCNYFLLEIRSRQPKEIVAAQVLEEATEEEINGVASLAEKCLRLKGEERPTMKEVETTLQQLRMNRTNSSQVDPSAEQEMQGHQSMTMNLAGRTYNVASQRSQNACYSLEQEFLASASLPR